MKIALNPWFLFRGGAYGVKLGILQFSNAMILYKYFAVTDSSTTVAFGPGLLKGNAVNLITSFVIQAKDKGSNNRTSGMDEFRCIVSKVSKDGNNDKDLNALAKSGKKIQSTIKDQGDGTYIVEYTPERCGAYVVQVDFLGTFTKCEGKFRKDLKHSKLQSQNCIEQISAGGKKEKPILGSPFCIDVVKDTLENSNQFNGQNFIQQTTASIQSFSEFAPACVTSLTKEIFPDDLKSLMSLKEQIRKIEENGSDYEITAASNRAALKYLKKR